MADNKELINDYNLISERYLRKHDWLSGTWVLLGNGEKWCVPSMPLGKKRKIFLSKIKEVIQLQNNIESLEEEEESRITIESTKEEIEKELERQKKIQKEKIEKSLELADTLLEKCLDLSVSLLRINYPKLTIDMVDERDLITSEHTTIFLSIARGEKEMANMIQENSGNDSNGPPPK